MKSKRYYVTPSGFGKGTTALSFRTRKKAHRMVGKMRKAGFKAKVSRK